MCWTYAKVKSLMTDEDDYLNLRSKLSQIAGIVTAGVKLSMGGADKNNPALTEL